MRITVLGAGSWGTTLAILLSENAHQVILWSHRDDHARIMLESRENRPLLPGVKIPSEIGITSDLEHSVAHAELIVTAIPTQFVRTIAERLRTHDFRGVMIVNVAKGIENKSLMTMSEVLIAAVILAFVIMTSLTALSTRMPVSLPSFISIWPPVSVCPARMPAISSAF